MGEFIGYIVVFGLWVYAIIQDAASDRIAWLLVGILVFPIGLVRGIYLLFGGG